MAETLGVLASRQLGHSINKFLARVQTDASHPSGSHHYRDGVVRMSEVEILSIAFLVVSIVSLLFVIFLCYVALKQRRRVDNIIDYVDSRSELVIKSADKLSKLQELNIGLLDYNDIHNHVSYIEQSVNEFLSELHRFGATDPDEITETLGRTVVNFFHEPRDTLDQNIMECNAKLLGSGFHILWVYSRIAEGSFESEMMDSLKRYFSSDSIELRRCAFLRMNESESRTPLDFSVAAPFFSDRAITYIGFPGDEMRNVALTIEHPGLLGGQINYLAILLISRIEDRFCEDGSTLAKWSHIKKAAERRINGIALPGS